MKRAVRRYTYITGRDTVNLQYCSLLLPGKVIWFDSFILLFGAGTSNYSIELLHQIRILDYVSIKNPSMHKKKIPLNDAPKTGALDAGFSNYPTIQYFLHNLIFLKFLVKLKMDALLVQNYFYCQNL